MLSKYLKDNNIKDFPNSEIEKLIDNYQKHSNNNNLLKLTSKLDEIKFVMPVNFEEGKLKNISLTTDVNGNRYIPIFTSIKECEKYEKTIKSNGYLIETLANISSILLMKVNIISGIVIDPLGLNLILTKEAIKDQNIAIYKEHEKTKTINNIVYSKPLYISDELIRNIKEFSKNRYYINKAYITLITQEEEYIYAIILDMDINENIFIYNDIIEEISPYSIFQIQPIILENNKVAEEIIKELEPIYEKAI